MKSEAENFLNLLYVRIVYNRQDCNELMREQIEFYNNLIEAPCILSEQSGDPISTGLQGASIWNMD